jgi:hypothetical protein
MREVLFRGIDCITEQWIYGGIVFEEADDAIRSGGYVSLSRNFPFLDSQTLDGEVIGNIHDTPGLLKE